MESAVSPSLLGIYSRYFDGRTGRPALSRMGLKKRSQGPAMILPQQLTVYN